jgi:hypothetical protein
MSITIDYFFNYGQELPKLKDDVNACLGCSLAPYERICEEVFDYFLGMEFYLGLAHRFENDGELDFESFRYWLSFRTPVGSGQIRPLQIPAMAAVAFALHHWYGITGILVYDMQILLARYEEREAQGEGKHLYDLVSEAAFTDFSRHLNDLKMRMPEGVRQSFF